MTDTRPFSEQPLPTRMVMWAVCGAIAIVVLAASVRVAMWLVGI